MDLEIIMGSGAKSVYEDSALRRMAKKMAAENGLRGPLNIWLGVSDAVPGVNLHVQDQSGHTVIEEL